jgi:uncharacterized protein with HEPN domain
LEAITHIEAFIISLDFGAYQKDLKTKSAVERQMQIITEAATRLGDDGPNVCPGIDWVGFRGMGNILRHAYHRIDDNIIWDTVKLELPLMRDAVVTALDDKNKARSREPSTD